MAPPGPVALAVRLAGRDRTGAFLSILIVTETEFERPALFVAEQMRAAPTVSEVRFVAAQPVEETTPLSGSSTDQLTLTSLVYQPLLPSVPVKVAVITGGVVSFGRG